MNAELKLIVFEEKNILQELLELLDNQYKAIIDKEIILLENITIKIESIGKKLATIEIKRRNFIKDEDFKSIIENSEDDHIKSVYGVSMDEEMINLIQFQHAYNASAKVISTIDSLLDVVVNGLVR